MATTDATALNSTKIRTLALRLARGSLTYALSSFGIRALNFFLFPLYTRFLSPAEYGIISLVETIAAAVAAVLGLGLDAGVRRLYFQYINKPLELKRYVSSVLRFAGISTLVAVSATLFLGPRVLTWAAPHFSIPFSPYMGMAITTAALLQIIQYRLSLYQVQERARSYGLLSIGVFLTTAVAVVVMVAFVHSGAFGMLLGKLLAAALAATGAIYLLRTWFGAPFEWKFVRETLSFSLPVVPHNLMALCLLAADRLILEHYRSLGEVGLYSLAYTLGMAMFLVSLSIGLAWQAIYFHTATNDGCRTILRSFSSGLVVLLTAIAIFGILIAQDFT